VTLIALVLLPPVLSYGTELSPRLIFTTGAVLAITALISGLLGVFGGGFVSGAIVADVKEAVEQLIAEYPDGDPDLIAEAAVRILDGAYSTTGPSTVHTFDRGEVAGQLGNALDYLIRVEKVLCDHEEIYPVFTSGTDVES
jgi:hypothetical protein